MFKNVYLDSIFVFVRRIIYSVIYAVQLLPIRKDKIVVLCYHSVGDDSWRYTVSLQNLKKQMSYMLSHYDPIELSDVEKFISGEKAINKPSFAVTFDDGYEDILQTKEYFKSVGIKPTVFVLGDTEKANRKVMENSRSFLSNAQIHELRDAGWGVGSHTMTHSDLAEIHDEQVIYEVVASKHTLEKSLGVPIQYIAYPLGNYTTEVLSAFDQAGYAMGLSMDDSYISRDTNKAIVPRVGVDGSHHFIEFIATISDAIIILRSFVKWAMKKRETKSIHGALKQVDVVVKYFWPVSAGTETNILETYSVLVESEWNITVHTSTDTLTEKNSLPLSQFHRGLWIRRYVFKFLGFWPKIKWFQTEIVALHNFNIFPYFQILIFVLFLKLIGHKKFKLILVPHGGFVLYTKHLSWLKRFIIPLFYYHVGAWLINSTVDGIRCVSKWERDEMIKKGIRPELLTVITNGTEKSAYDDVDASASDDIRAKVAQYGTYIVQMGRIEPVKNYETTIRALKFLPDHVNYIIVGPVQDPHYLVQLRTLIAELHLTKRVHFAGVVHGADKYYLLKHAEMMVHMSVWESYCNAVHEGMSQGLVCIVSNVTGLPELVRDGSSGYCIDPYDYETLATRVNSILQHKDTKELRIITERNSKGVRMRSWGDVATDYARMVVALL